MRFVRFDGDRLGLLTDDDGIVDLTDRLDISGPEPLVAYAKSDADASEYADAEADYDLGEVRLESPVGRPGKVIGTPLNYEDHVAEMDGFEMSLPDAGYFLKAPSSVVGPEDAIELPFSDRRCDYEAELAFVIGEDTKDVSEDEAWENILGYTVLLDISVRGDQDRSNRKSYDTFTVVGPCVVTPDEVGDPHDLELELTLNGERRQHANTGEMIYDCAEILQYSSIGTTVEAGDIITTGTPSGVGALADGDEIHAEIENVGALDIDVTERDRAFADVNVK